MPDQDRRGERRAVTVRPVRTAEPQGCAEWQDLFVEPELPPVEEDDDA